jgi:hypothetical protein
MLYRVALVDDEPDFAIELNRVHFGRRGFGGPAPYLG